ncbi:MAG: DNA polymerase III subunit gamma/tau, partial [Pseudomonadota bacterium]
NTGVNDVREIIDSVRYRAASARYKVYIIDEVHMLSTSAFNALLKTLEEPPAHVKFIFATTEIRKVPVTVLSRCQRFDLRRIEPEVMMDHLGKIATAEGGRISREALALITRAAEGSVRDALSLLDQAIAHGTGEEMDAAGVRAMLGLADRGRVIDLFEKIMGGDAAGALSELGQQYAEGADPSAVLRDLAELTHWISVVKISPDAAEDPTVNPDERARSHDLASRLPMRALTRSWQMLLKAMEELAIAPNAMMAAEMAVIRLTHVADLPTPGDLVRKLTEETALAPSGSGSRPAPGGGTQALAVVGGTPQVTPAPAPTPEPQTTPVTNLDDIAALLRDNREMVLLTQVEDFVHLVDCRPGVLEFNTAEGAPHDLAGRLGAKLSSLTGQRWAVAITDAPGQPTLRSRREDARAGMMAQIRAHPMFLAALETFGEPQNVILKPLSSTPVETRGDFLAPAQERDEVEGDLLDKDDEDWGDDPFKED